MQNKIIITVLFVTVFGFLGSEGLSKESNLEINNENNLTKNWVIYLNVNLFSL